MGLASCGTKKKPAGDDEAGTMKQYQLEEAWRTDTLLLVPESVIYDAVNDVLYVSNLNYEPRMKDGNGFISRVSTEGEILDLRWVEEMSSPKGMGIYDGRLYVSDVDEVIIIDISAGEIVERILVEGAKMLNDIAIDEQGKVYVTDSDNNSILMISGGEVSNWLGEGLSGPNGLLFDGDRLLLASMGSQDLAAIDLETKEITVITDSINFGDGIAPANLPGHILVSDWAGEVFLVCPDGSKSLLLDTRAEEIGAADITYIPEQNLLLVPTFYKQMVVAYRLVEEE